MKRRIVINWKALEDMGLILMLIVLFLLSMLVESCSKQFITAEQKDVSLVPVGTDSPHIHKFVYDGHYEKGLLLDTSIVSRNPDIPVIWLCFNGDSSNSDFGDVVSEESGLSTEQKEEVIDSVRTWFSPFNCNITGSRDAYMLATKRIKVVITTTYLWSYKFYPNGCTGIAYISSYLWNDDTPAYVFTPACQYVSKYVAFYVAHELGHILGLYHQVTWRDQCSQYDFNVGDGQKSPFMSVATDLAYSWWSGSTPNSCSAEQDDSQTIMQTLASNISKPEDTKMMKPYNN